MPEQTDGVTDEPEAAPDGRTDLLSRPRIRLGAVVAIAVAAGLLAWAFVGRDDDGSSSATATTTTTPSGVQTDPIKVSEEGLVTLSNAFSQPIYWMGQKPGFTYELLRTGDGSVYVRYLPKGVAVGDPRADFTIVATYPFKGSFEALKASAAGREVGIPGGGIALVDESYPQSVHMSYPGVDYQIEVYDPSPERSREIALSGDVRPVG